MLNSISSNSNLNFSGRATNARNDGKVDADALRGFENTEALVTDLRDSRLEAVLSGKVKDDGAALGEEWKGTSRSLPIYSNRGIIGLDEKSQFKTDGQTLDIDWNKKTVTVRTEAPGAVEGHQIQASMDWGRHLLTDSIQESSYIIAG